MTDNVKKGIKKTVASANKQRNRADSNIISLPTDKVQHKNNLQIALDLVGNDFGIFPLKEFGGVFVKGSKKKGYTEDEVKEHWKANPAHNIALILRSTFNDLVAVKIEIISFPEAGDLTEQEKQALEESEVVSLIKNSGTANFSIIGKDVDIDKSESIYFFKRHKNRKIIPLNIPGFEILTSDGKGNKYKYVKYEGDGSNLFDLFEKEILDFPESLLEIEAPAPEKESVDIYPKPFIEEDNKGKQSINHVKLSDYVRENYNLTAFISTATKKKTFFTWTEKEGYHEITEDEIKDILIKETGDLHTRHIILSAYEHLTAHLDKIKGEFFNNLGWDLIPVNNGFVEIKSGKLLPFHKDLRHDFKFNVDYDPTAKADKFKGFMEHVLGAGTLPFLQYSALTIYEGNPIPTIMFMVGSGREGKSVIIRQLEEILGNKSRNYPLAQLNGSNRFMPANFYGKRANICADDRTTATENLEQLKGMSGGDRMDLEMKGIQESIQTRLNIKFLFAMNQTPRINEITQATKHRIIPIKVRATRETSYAYIEENFDNKGLNFNTGEIFLEEKSGFFNLILATLQKMIEEKRTEIYLPEEVRAYKKKWFDDNDLIQQFLDGFTEEIKNPDIKATHTLKKFTALFKHEMDLKNFSSQKMRTELESRGIQIGRAYVTKFYNGHEEKRQDRNAVLGLRLTKEI